MRYIVFCEFKKHEPSARINLTQSLKCFHGIIKIKYKGKIKYTMNLYDS